jgi:DNA polymerase delta subunit 2
MAATEELLRKWSKDETFTELHRLPSAYTPMYSFVLPKGENKNYLQQFSDIYFLRLAKLKPSVEASAKDAWEGFEIAGEPAQKVERVLDVRQGQLCWVAGTIYMDLALKPNILDELSKEHWVAGPPPRQSYFSSTDDIQVMLEDESGRLRLAGASLRKNLLVTGVIVAVLGTENADGDFDVLDLQVADLPRQPQRWELDEGQSAVKGKMDLDHDTEAKKVAIVSGLGISGTEADTLGLSLLAEYLLGEALDTQDQILATKVCRLIIAGNSISSDVITAPTPDAINTGTRKAAHKKYGYDSAAYNPIPTAHLDQFLSELLPSIPITIMPGEHDPANVSLPQQPIHPAMFPHSRAYSSQHVNLEEGSEPGWFDSVTNPWDGDVEGWRLMGNSGQPVDDILKYVDHGGPHGTGSDGRLEVMESILRWRCGAPTAPDTLCEQKWWYFEPKHLANVSSLGCYPFQEKDQFVIEECPHVYFVGNQPKFDTTIIEGPAGQRVRLVTVPKFHETGQIVLLDTETLEVELIKIEIHDATDEDVMT